MLLCNLEKLNDELIKTMNFTNPHNSGYNPLTPFFKGESVIYKIR